MAQADYIYLDGRPVAVLNGSTLYFLHDDRLGTPQVASDSSQNIAWQASYDSFGQASVSGTITQNLRFPGQYFDVESGWNHNGFRDYVPMLGRYIEPDPLGRLGSGNNLYAYVANNPTNLVDPLGLCPSRNCSVGPASAGQYAAAIAEVAKMTAGFFSGLGPDQYTFGPDSAVSQVMAQSSQFQDVLNQYYMSGTTSNWEGFGAAGYAEAGANPVAQFLGSFGWSIAPTNGGINVTLTNVTSFHSLMLDEGPAYERFPMAVPTGPSSWTVITSPMGNVGQTITIKAVCR